MKERPTNGDPLLDGHLSLETTEPIAVGHGWIAGVISAVLGVVGLGAVICIRFPSLTVPAWRYHYPLFYLRGTLHLVLVTPRSFWER
ncbi:MAG: hypothetical protein U1D30_07325 [Planctomycetota bacterium]